MHAWFSANAAIEGLSDRWIGYVREQDAIVEYSARAETNPPKVQDLVTLGSSGKVKAAASLLSKYAQPKLSATHYRLASGKRNAKSLRSNSAAFLPGQLTDEFDAIGAAREWLSNNQGPADATFDRATAVERTDAQGVTSIVGYAVRFIKSVNGFAVRANGVAPHVTLLVSGNTVVSSISEWADATATVATKASVSLDLGTALTRAATEISRVIKSDAVVQLVAAEPCLGKSRNGNELVPAYRVLDASGGAFVIDAATGNLL
jgi:hypothetical protein